MPLTPAPSAEPAPAASEPGPLPPAPRWAVRAAHATVLVTLPSGLWRLLLAAGMPAGYTEAGFRALGSTGWGALLVVAVSVTMELLALATLALVRPWGERLPGRLPLLGGRRIPPRALITTAWLTVVALAAVWTALVGTWWLIPKEDMTPLGVDVVGLLYVPTVAWGPLLAAVTLSFQRRHRSRTVPGQPA